MEVQRSTKPDVAFLKRIREIADANGIVLIFDECTSGFREAFWWSPSEPRGLSGYLYPG